jgi:glycerol-3-phosphate dehydrogenase
MWERLGEEVDLLVIGGGITGAGIARDAARRGLRVALAEMNDFAYGTSSRSSKLVHGGLRYLEQREVSLVFESVSERRVLMDLAPHLVNPLGFIFPVYETSKHKLWVINAGMWLYDGLSLFRSPKIHRTLRPKEVAELEPALDRHGLKGAPLYYDCSTDDARLTLENAIDAAAHGAAVVSWARVVRFEKDGSGRAHGAVVRDAFTGEEKPIRALAIVNATGPWSSALLALASPGREPTKLRPTKGVHIVVDQKKLPVGHAIVCNHPHDARVLFVIPWGDRTYVGTTDTDYHGDPADVAATRDDVEYLIAAVNAHFPGHQLRPDDVISTWAGIRPLVAPPETAEVSESQVSREHQITVGNDGLITISGGKLTTYRRMAAEVVDTAVRLLKLSGALGKRPKLAPSDTDEEPLPGGVGWPENDDHDEVARAVKEASSDVLPDDVALHLANTYGMRALALAEQIRARPALAERLVAGRPEIVGQIDWAVNEELAATISDVMIRRTQLFYRDHDQGLGAVPTVARRMQELLGWDDDAREKRVEAYRADVALSRRWKG